jgi:GDPmannose 4,6-dehydratase
MGPKKALITGISGQDGSYLAEYLLGLGYEVHGMVMHVELEDRANRLWRLRDIMDRVCLHSGSLDSYAAIYSIVDKVRPDECYHLAAQSFVNYSFEEEFSTINTNVNGTHYVLSALKNISPECHVYFAASSEMFGRVEEVPQNERTPFRPRSIYGISKVAGYDLTRNYRETYDMFSCSGILYNHESPRRGSEFVTRKITSTAAKIKLGKAKKLYLGNLEARRDWGDAREYIKIMHKMLQGDEPKDYVVGTGELHSVREFAETAFAALDLDYRDHVEIDERYFRPAEKNPLVADPAKAREELGWDYRVPFKALVADMVRADHEMLRAKG